MLDGVLVASNVDQTQPLGAGGTPSSPVDIPTIGESVSGFWPNNRYEGGFVGVVDRFRSSTAQQDWRVSSGCGDVDRDGEVSIIDALMIARHTAGLPASGTCLADGQSGCGDVDGDGEVSIIDALMIARHIAGLPASGTCLAK